MEGDVIQLFEAAKKAADTASTKGILLGQTEVSRCVNTLSKLKNFPVSRRILQANRVEEKLELLTKHTNQKIRFTASTLLLRWRQCIKNQERQDSRTLIEKSSDLQPKGIRQETEDKPKKPLEVSGKLGSCVSKGRDHQPETVHEKKTIPTNKADLLELLQTVEKEAEAAAEGSSSSSVSRCVEALYQIERTSWSLVHDAIFTTRIGNRVHSLIHHRIPEIRSAAESLYYGWLRILYSSNGNSNNSSSQKKMKSKSTNRKSSGSTGKECRNDRINSVLRKWKSIHRH